jgi:hypothetical protein
MEFWSTLETTLLINCFNTGTEVLNKQNMGFMRNGLQETANSKNSNPAISDRGIAQLINNVVSRVDQNSIQQSTIWYLQSYFHFALL